MAALAALTVLPVLAALATLATLALTPLSAKRKDLDLCHEATLGSYVYQGKKTTGNPSLWSGWPLADLLSINCAPAIPRPAAPQQLPDLVPARAPPVVVDSLLLRGHSSLQGHHLRGRQGTKRRG